MTHPQQNNEIRVRFGGKKDVKKKDYYVAHVHIPASINLSDLVMLFFPDEDENGVFGGDLVLKIPERQQAKSKRENGQ